MMDKSRRGTLVIVSLLEHNLNQQISLFNFCSFNSTRKVNIDESFVSSKGVRKGVLGLTPPLGLDILRKVHYLRRGD